MATSNKKILIVGGGFGGLNVARGLAGRRGFEITLIDRRNHHLFQPLLYQVAMAGLSPADIAMPIRGLFTRAENVQVVLDEVVAVDAAANKVRTAKGASYEYDELVLACGATHSYFGREEWEEFAPGLKTVEHATEIRRRVLTAFEEAEIAPDPESARRWLTFVVIGGGPTGVELAGSLAELARMSLSRDFRHISPDRARVILVEAGNRVLATFDEKLSKQALADLEDLGVQVWTSTRVSEVSAEGVKLGSDFIATKTVFWAAGVKASPLGTAVSSETDRSGRVPVGDHLQVKGFTNIYAIGDMASLAEKGKPLPGVAPVAMQQGRYLAKLLRRKAAGKTSPAFHYIDKGSMATIGRNKAVMEAGSLKVTGRLAWAAWLFIHIYYLSGFRNRTLVFMQWAWSYFTYKRGARLIVSKDWRSGEAAASRVPNASTSIGSPAAAQK